MSIEILDCLKRQRDICVKKTVIPSQNTAFMFTPALIASNSLEFYSMLHSEFTNWSWPKIYKNIKVIKSENIWREEIFPKRANIPYIVQAIP